MASVMAQTQRNLGISTLEDSMEISSDAGRQGEDEIDIDIDVSAEDSRYVNEDEMVDDHATDLPDDDVMVDEDTSVPNVEEQMEEDLIDYQDEELDEELGDADVTGDETELLFDGDGNLPEAFHDSGATSTAELRQVDDSAKENQQTISQGDQSQPDIVMPQQSHDPENGPGAKDGEATLTQSHDQAASEHLQEDIQPTDGQVEGQAVYNIITAEPAVVSDVAIDPGVQVSEDHTLGSEQRANELLEVDGVTAALARKLDSVPSNNSTEASPKQHDLTAEGPSSTAIQTLFDATSQNKVSTLHDENYIPEDDKSSRPLDQLHPVLVLWEDEEVPLFPLDDVSEFFLEDTSLADGHINALFAGFRLVLQDDYSDQSNLCIEFDELGLTIDELPPEPFDTTLADIVNVYLHLHRNEANYEPEPLRLTLKMKEKPTARFSFLLQAASDGKGMAHIRNLYQDALEAVADYSSEHDSEQTPTENQQPGLQGMTGREHRPPSLSPDGSTGLPAKIIEESDENASPQQSEATFESDADHNGFKDHNSTEFAAPGRPTNQIAESGVDNHGDPLLELEYYEEDLFDDVYGFKSNADELNESERPLAIPGDEFQVDGAQEPTERPLNSPGENSKEGFDEEFDFKAWEGQQDYANNAPVELKSHKDSEGMQSSTATHHTFNDFEDHSSDGNINRNPSHLGADHSNYETTAEAAQSADPLDNKRTAEVKGAALMNDGLNTPEPALDDNQYLHSHDELDLGEQSSETQDDAYESPPFVDELQSTVHDESAIEVSAQGHPASGEFLEQDSTDVDKASPINVPEAPSKLVRKRSWDEQETGEQGASRGSDPKKARAG